MSGRTATGREARDPAVAPESLAARLADAPRTRRISRRQGRRSWRRFAARVERVADDLRTVFRALSDSPDQRARQPRSAEWLADNEHVVEEALRQVRDSLPRRFHRQLPRWIGSDGSAVTRVQVVADAVTQAVTGHPDGEWLTRFVKAYQERAVLTIGELWALPAMLRLAVLERLAAVGTALVAGAPGVPEDDALSEEAAEDVADCVLGLRFLAEHDWKEFFESVSLVDAVLREDPAGVYAGMDFGTRDAYRKAVERLSRRSPLDEPQVARAALELAREAAAPGLGRHVGHHLVDAGVTDLEAETDYHASPALRVRRRFRRRAFLLYTIGICALTVGLVALAAFLATAADVPVTRVIVLTAIALTPASAAAVGIANYVASLLTSPRVLPKLDPDAGIRSGNETLVVVPSLLVDGSTIAELLRDLEINFLGNRDPHLHFALLTDLTDADRQELPEDERLVRAVVDGIRSLNHRHGDDAENGPFHLLHRPRRWNSVERRWMGWERKRGKLSQLNRALASSADIASALDAFPVRVGDTAWLRRVRLGITLDADTFLPRGAAARLVATMAHPLNRPRFANDGRVEGGYTVLQPRIEVNPGRADRTRFARVFTGDRGLDLYNSAASDAYQDLFAEGSFSGKGIYDLVAFERSLAGRVPENRILSHDLFEGIHGRSGLVSDILVLEDSPLDFPAHARRTHRWIRGDWQLLPWLLPRVPGEDGARLASPLSALDRWKILDNLRRSLVAPSLLAMLAYGWSMLPGAAWLWTVLAAGSLAVPVLLTATIGLQRSATARPWIPMLRSTRHSLEIDSERWLLTLSFLPHEAMMSVDAIGRTLWRLTVSKRRLLEWTAAAQQARGAAGPPRRAQMWRTLALPPIIALALAALLASSAPQALTAAAPLLLLWLLAPELALRTARESLAPTEPPDESERHLLRSIAHRTWQFFERTVTAEDHWLPPDHYQEEPGEHLARRTSPTNMGMLLLGTAAAWDLGYLTTSELTARVGNSLDSMGRLRRYRGHFLNWYDTATRETLSPEYVSTVDSGNLAGSLVALQQACLEIADAPLVRAAHGEALADATRELCDVLEKTATEHRTVLLEHVRETCAALRREHGTRRDAASLARWILVGAPDLVTRLCDTIISLADARPRILGLEELAALRGAGETATARLDDLGQEIDAALPWLADPDPVPAAFLDNTLPDLHAGWKSLARILEEVPSPRGFPEFAARVRRRVGALRELLERPSSLAGAEGAEQEKCLEWLRRLEAPLDRAERRVLYLAADLEQLGHRCSAFVDAMDFAFLLDGHRGVFHLGYSVPAGTLDHSYYDLLASEARLASFLAIAKGDVPPDHWLSLGRPFGHVEGTWSLLSWSGTSFEYLMPALLMDTPPRTLLGRSCATAIERQMTFASGHRVPWGISESAYHELDADSRYRYRAFGVPGLGLASSLGERLVISPYASILALPFRPRQVIDNLGTMISLGALGRYGLFDALDFGRTAVQPPRIGHPVRSYMAHHQGMILAAIANRLCDDVLRRRFHADRSVCTAAPLVHERLPDRISGRRSLRRAAPPAGETGRRQRSEPWLVEPHHPCPQLNLLSNGRLRVLVSAAGGGAMWWKSEAMTRWTPDAALGTSGHWIYLHDAERDLLWSVGSEPTRTSWDEYEPSFDVSGCEITRRSHGIVARLRVAVAPDDDVEVRRLELHNDTDERRRLRVTGYAEVVLARGTEARRHPAFARLFVESSFDTERGVLSFRRRPRHAGETPRHLAHALDVVQGGGSRPWFETDRERFLGRLGSVADPAGLAPRASGREGALGATLDPVMVLGREVEIPARGRTVLSFLTAVGRSRDAALAAIERHRAPWRLDAVLRRTREQGEHELRQLGIPADAAPSLQELLSALLFPRASARAPREVLASNRLSQQDLWRFGISGDAPILLAVAADGDAGSFLDSLIRGHARWLRQGLAIDLVIVDDTGSGYAHPLRDRIRVTVEKVSPHGWARSPGGVHLVEQDQLSPGERVLLESTARLVLRSDEGPLALQLAALWEGPHELPGFVPMPSTPVSPRQLDGPGALDRCADLRAGNELGGFTADGREYVIHLEPGCKTPAPWANVIANPEFGCLVTESGGGCTWSLNSSENRLTSWHNDPLLDPPAEVVYLRDEETGRVWSATPSPCPGPGPYQVRHGAGRTVFRHVSRGIEQELEICVDAAEAVKIVTLRVKDLLGRPRRLTATYYAEWVLGVDRPGSAPHLVSEYVEDIGALLVRNPFHGATAERVAFLAAGAAIHGVTADRVEFLGAPGSLQSPAALRRIGLSGRVEPGCDPCGVLQLHLNVPAGGEIEAHFLLGQAVDRSAALALVKRFQPPSAAAAARKRSAERWDELLQAVSVQTPDPAMDLMLDRWLPYQAISCRMWGRAGVYQSSGAFGFRDQLQDSLALLWSAPELTREHLLRAASQQFAEGDVLHWWHPPGGKGVRTRCSDDMLWLPFVAAEFVRATGDVAVLEEQIPFLDGEPLADEETERYAVYRPGDESRPLYEHCLRALRRGITAGPHGLPLIGSGDWNDGLNRVGIEGRGESVWLGWFLHATLSRFAPLCEERGDPQTAADLRGRAEELRSALEGHAWDGEWYRRAYFDDGTPLGSRDSPECRIDLTAQTWAVLSGAAAPERQRQAMTSVDRLLIREHDRLVLLLAPPFDTAPWDPGYIQGYPPGVRENGGQYTHAATWAAWAHARLGDGDRAWQLFDLLNPVRRQESPQAMRRYRVEPYVLAGDIYGAPPHVGRGGWTWYTGSAAWMYRLGIEAILGLRLAADGLVIAPCIPRAWPGFRAVVRRAGARYEIHVDNSAGTGHGVAAVEMDGKPVPGAVIPWQADGTHRVKVRLGGC